ncbi:hypothetical protein D3C85_860020 [compost metagenome]
MTRINNRQPRKVLIVSCVDLIRDALPLSLISPSKPQTALYATFNALNAPLPEREFSDGIKRFTLSSFERADARFLRRDIQLGTCLTSQVRSTLLKRCKRSFNRLIRDSHICSNPLHFGVASGDRAHR